MPIVIADRSSGFSRGGKIIRVRCPPLTSSRCMATMEMHPAAMRSPTRSPFSDDMTYFTPDEYKGWEWGCGFAFAYESASDEDNKDWTVILACGGEGESYSSLAIISEQKSPQGGQFTVTITENDKSTTLQLCQ